MGRIRFSLVLILFFLLWGRPAGAQTALHIGTVQGSTPASPFEGELVTIQGVVTGRYRSQNSEGRIFHTLFVQEAVGAGDQNPITSDAVPVFVGENEINIDTGDLIRVRGRVKEFYDLTELISSSSQITLLARGQPLPEPVAWPFPAEPAGVESLEGMLIEYGPAVVAGPTHAGCGFALLPRDSSYSHSHRHNVDTFDSHLLTVQFADELNCEHLPDLKVGDVVPTLIGPLNYNFDSWRLLLRSPELSELVTPELSTPPAITLPDRHTVRLVSLNLHNYFDERRDSDHEAEPLISIEQQEQRQDKIAAVVSQLLDCPALIAIQEVENEALLLELARAIAPLCGFKYGVAHEPSADARGIDVALLYSPELIRIEGVSSRQQCSAVPTEVVDESINCSPGQNPLFSRPPLFVHLLADDEPLLVIVVHLKSKRGGAVETEPIRLAQAEALLAWREAANRSLIIVGDVNDYRDSAPLRRLTSTDLFNVLTSLPEREQYSFIFDGYAQLLDAVLITADLRPFVVQQSILHINADYPASWETATEPDKIWFSISDHDIPLLDLRWETPEAIQTATATAPPPESELSVVTAESEAPLATSTEAEIPDFGTPTPIRTPAPVAAAELNPTLSMWDKLLLILAATLSAGLLLGFGRKMLRS